MEVVKIGRLGLIARFGILGTGGGPFEIIQELREENEQLHEELAAAKALIARAEEISPGIVPCFV